MDEIDIEALPENTRHIVLKVIAKRNEEVAKRNAKWYEEIAKKDEEIAIRNEELSLYSIERFWKCGFRGLQLSKRGSVSSTHTSTHTDIGNFKLRSFAILNIETHNSSAASLFLVELQRQENNKLILYLNEAEVMHRVRLIILDVLLCLAINTQVSIHYQASVVSVVETGRGESKSNIVVVETKYGVPIAVIVVKEQGSSKLSNPKVLGQVFDYMSNLRNSYGQCEVFGIVTTLDQWRVVWFPDTDEFAASGDLEPPMYEDLQVTFPWKVHCRDPSMEVRCITGIPQVPFP